MNSLIQSEHRITQAGRFVAMPPAKGEWRITEFVQSAGRALSSLFVCLPSLLQARPKTPLRVLCIAAFEYLARCQGGGLGRDRRLTIAHACDFGSLLDEYYDERKLDSKEYRSLRKALRRLAPRAATARYLRQLRNAERGRPRLSERNPGIAIATQRYRAAVIILSLRWLQGIAELPIERGKFHSLVNLICLMQLADDILDWKEDHAQACPSYVTALLLNRPPAAVTTALRAQANRLLQRTIATARDEAATLPFALAGMATWMFVVALLRFRFPR